MLDRPEPMIRRVALTAVLTVGLVGLLGAPRGAASAATAQAEGGCEVSRPATCSLSELAALVPLRIGSTAEAEEVVDGPYADTLAREFSSLTPENALKWYSTQPNPGEWRFEAADAVVGFAREYGMQVRGHTLLWAQDTYTPTWVSSIDNAAELNAAVETQIRTVVGRYAGSVARWDVVNEPLSTLGTGPSDSVFWSVLGPDWIADAFRLAHELDPTAELWLNEIGSDWVPGKHQALLDLVSGLIDQGVPIHGVGIQGHRLNSQPVDGVALAAQMREFTDLGLSVAITELDVATDPSDPDGFTAQAGVYRSMFEACLAVAGCEEVTMWGLTDASTWLDSIGIVPAPTRPLLFDEQFMAKPAYWAVHGLLAQQVAPPTSSTTSTPQPAPNPPAPPTLMPAAPVPAVPRFTG